MSILERWKFQGECSPPNTARCIQTFHTVSSSRLRTDMSSLPLSLRIAAHHSACGCLPLIMQSLQKLRTPPSHTVLFTSGQPPGDQGQSRSGWGQGRCSGLQEVLPGWNTSRGRSACWSDRRCQTSPAQQLILSENGFQGFLWNYCSESSC